MTSGDDDAGGTPIPMRVDVVTGPVRYRVAPLLMLLLVMLVPVVALAGLLVWSDRQADAYEAHEPGDDEPTTPAAVRPASPVLASPMLTYRRLPKSVSAQAADHRLAAAMDQLYGYLGERSCAAVSIDGRIASVHNDTVPVIPASTHKLLVAAVALERLGTDYRYTTELRGPMAIDGVIDGDVHLVGGGDPLLTANDYPIAGDSQPAFNTTSLDALVDGLVVAGVTRINGEVLGDGSRYDDEWQIPSWGPGVAGVEAGPYDALMVNDSRAIGRFGRQNDPNLTGARELARLLDARGIAVRGFDTGTAPPDAMVLSSVQSVPLAAIVDEMLTTSDDDTAEMMLKELGVVDSGAGTVAAGLNVVDRTLREWGLPMDGVRLVDASGLSSENRLTCGLLVRLLDRVAETSIPTALPLAGRTGTLTTEFVGSAVEGRLLAKTGSLGNPPAGLDPPAVKGLAGYLETDDGGSIRFALVLNADGADGPEVYRAFWDGLAIRLAEYPVGPELDDLRPR